ncbi:fibrocystin-L-like isoform X1 [Scylla paramamosain]|uniref:fibrocystin-L-like isoform X1 n=1 Tax=Scylla paramamosain TaxID=85552 RepID=UPI003082E57C
MNATVYVTGRGASEVTKTGMYVDSQDRLYQFHTYAGMHNVSPLRGSSQGGTLFTIDGVGFDPYKEQTKVLVGDAQCAIQDITDEQIRCLTPTQGKTSAGSGERRLLVELYQGEYFESNFLEETSWAALSPSHAGYKAFVPQDAELKFPIEVTRDTVGTLKGYLHPPHDGTYSLSVQVGERMLVMLAANGDSDSEFEVMQWQEFELKKGTPAYLEIRFQTRATTDFTLAMKDFHTKFTRRSTPQAVNERQRVTLDIIQRWEVQHIEIRGTSPVTGVLYLDGMTSPVIDIADPAQVQEQLLDMTEQKCHVYLSGIQTMHYRTFEDKIGLPGMLGTVVGDVEPFCGRKVFRLSRNEPRIFREAASNSMINANTLLMGTYRFALL